MIRTSIALSLITLAIIAQIVAPGSGIEDAIEVVMIVGFVVWLKTDSGEIALRLTASV